MQIDIPLTPIHFGVLFFIANISPTIEKIIASTPNILPKIMTNIYTGKRDFESWLVISILITQISRNKVMEMPKPSQDSIDEVLLRVVKFSMI